MKKCPKCNAITLENNTCHICGTSIVFQEMISEEKEKVYANKYYLLYLLKNCAFSIVCLIISSIAMLVQRPAFDNSYLLIFGIGLLSLAASVFKRTFVKMNRCVCTERHSKRMVDLFIVLSGMIPLAFVAVMWL